MLEHNFNCTNAYYQLNTGANFFENWNEIKTFSFNKNAFENTIKISAILSGFNVLCMYKHCEFEKK